MSLVWQSVFPLGSFLIRMRKGMRIATPVCALARNDIRILQCSKFQFIFLPYANLFFFIIHKNFGNTRKKSGTGLSPIFGNSYESSAFIGIFQTNASISPLTGQPMLMHIKFPCPTAFLFDGVYGYAWEFNQRSPSDCQRTCGFWVCSPWSRPTAAADPSAPWSGGWAFPPPR